MHVLLILLVSLPAFTRAVPWPSIMSALSEGDNDSVSSSVESVNCLETLTCKTVLEHLMDGRMVDGMLYRLELLKYNETLQVLSKVVVLREGDKAEMCVEAGVEEGDKIDVVRKVEDVLMGGQGGTEGMRR